MQHQRHACALRIAGFSFQHGFPAVCPKLYGSVVLYDVATTDWDAQSQSAMLQL